jgi:hypothetical protein
MKGFLTFTLAAGVAISTTSVTQAAGVKGAVNASKAPTSVQAPMSIGGMGLSLDRMALSRELDRLNAMLNPVDDLNQPANEDDRMAPKSFGTWTY